MTAENTRSLRSRGRRPGPGRRGGCATPAHSARSSRSTYSFSWCWLAL
jgi:hypothetical protein